MLLLSLLESLFILPVHLSHEGRRTPAQIYAHWERGLRKSWTGTLFLPATGGQGAAPGGTMSCVAESLPNHPVALAASLGLRGPTAVPFGIAWVDPATFVVLRIGITDGSGRMTTTIAIPPGIPRGLPLTVQTAAGSPTNQTLVLGVPAVLHVL